MRLLPREEKFFTDFINQVNNIDHASRVLLDAVKAGNSHLSIAATTIRSLEQKGDEMIHDILTRLNSTFITPLDPEDIHSIASHLDDIMDGIEETAHCLVAYRVEPIPPTVPELCHVIIQCSQALHKAFEALSKDQPMGEHCIEVNRLEDLADNLTRKAISDLFQSEKDPIALIKLKEIYETLEATIDFCEDVADVLQGVLVKNS